MEKNWRIQFNMKDGMITAVGYAALFGMLLGILLTASIITSSEIKVEELKQEAVKRGYAEHVILPDNQKAFKWLDK